MQSRIQHSHGFLKLNWCCGDISCFRQLLHVGFPRFPEAKHSVIATRQLSKESWEHHQAGTETDRSSEAAAQKLPEPGMMLATAARAFLLLNPSYFHHQTRGVPGIMKSMKSFSGFCQMFYQENIIQTCYFSVLVMGCLSDGSKTQDSGGGPGPTAWGTLLKAPYLCSVGHHEFC